MTNTQRYYVVATCGNTAVEFQRGTLTGETKQEQWGPKAKKQYLKSITHLFNAVFCSSIFVFLSAPFSLPMEDKNSLMGK
jgi:phosphoserine phosphatase